MALLLIILGAPAAATAASLDDIDFASLPGGRVQLRLKLSQPPAQAPLNFTIDNPARIAIDLPNTQLKMREKSKTIGVGMARSVSAAEAAGRTRVVVNLAHMGPYDIKLQGGDILVTLNATAASKDDALPLPLGQAPTRGASIQNID
ncbi:MAG: AMIN domain-containing protein, partial [Gammaproteobacteria bacterium]